MQFDIGIRAGLLLSMQGGRGEVANDQFIGIRGEQITAVTTFQDSLAKECKRFIDASSKLIIPGLINGHTHLAMSLFRGYEDDVNFHDWLYKKIFPLEANLVDAEFVEVGVALSALECIRFGTTTVNDMYFFPEITAAVLDRAGLRAIVATPFMDFVMPDEKHYSPEQQQNLHVLRTERFLKFMNSYQGHSRIIPALGPHAPYTVSDELMATVKALAEKHPLTIQMHVSETVKEVEDSRAQYGLTPVMRLEKQGMLKFPFVIAHGIHFTPEEVELLQKRKNVSVIYNPDSNSKLGSGVAPIPQYRRSGMTVGIGSDGAASNNDLSLFGAMDLGTKIQKLTHHDNTAMTALDAITIATYEGARALHLQDKVGTIEEGKQADLVILDLDEPHVRPLHSVLSQLVYAFQGLEVETVLCAGQLLMENRNFKTLDKNNIFKEAELMKQKIAAFRA